MTRRRVVTTPEADDDAKRIDEWWVRSRTAAPNLFVEELADALALLGVEAGIGVRCAHRAIPGLRRYLLRSTRYHLYFVYSDELVVIVGIWGATRRATPRFADRAASAKHALAAQEISAGVPGFVNRNQQEVVRVIDTRYDNPMQHIHELRCRYCGHQYGAKDSEISQRNCPDCQGGAPGVQLEEVKA